MGHSTINSEESIDMTVKSVLIHPGYEASKALNDIALLRLNQSLIFNTTIQPISLPSDDLSSNSKYFETRKLQKNISENLEPTAFVPSTFFEILKHYFGTYISYFVAGRGQEKAPRGASLMYNLKELELEIARDDSCFGLYDNLNANEKELRNSHEICAQSFKPPMEGVCYVDSGSPLMKIDSVSGRIEIIGIASRISRTTCTHQSFYTRVTKFLPWIHQNLKEFDPQNVNHLNYNNEGISTVLLICIIVAAMVCLVICIVICFLVIFCKDTKPNSNTNLINV